MSRNIVPRVDKGADLGTPEKNWNKLYADAIFLSNNNLWTLLNSKTNLNTLTNKGDLYTATGPGSVVRLPRGNDGYVLKSDSSKPEGLMWGPAGARQELTDNITVYVGETGDFPTINAALENVVALYYPKFISTGCPRVTIKLMSGFVMSEQVLIESLDLSWITIKGDDPETMVNSSAITKYFNDGYPVFGVNNGGFLPVIGQLFNLNTPTSHGITLKSNSRAIVLPNCGVKNVSGYGLWANQSSIVDAAGANFSGAGIHCIYVTNSSIVNADGLKINNGNGVLAYYNSIINVANTIIEVNSNGIRVEHGSTANVVNANITAAGNGIYVRWGSIANADGSTVTGSPYGIVIENGSIVNAHNTTASLNATPNQITSNGIIFKNV